MNILLVDDDTGFLDQAKIFLERCDDEYQVVTCETAAEALDKVEDDEFDIVVSDQMMPVMSGLELLESIRKSGYDIPFIMLTGKGREEIAMDALNLGADRYIQKGGDPRSQYNVLAREIRQEVERYRTKCKLREREELYRIVTESFYDMITLVDLKEDKILLISEAVGELLGYSPEELTGKHFFDLFHPGDREDVYRQLKEQIESGDTQGMFKDRIMCKDGSYKWIENRFRILKDDEEQPDKLLIVARDVTQDGMVKAELTNIAKKYKNIFENAWIAILVLNADTTVSMVNKRFEELSGYKKEEIEHKKSWTEFVHGDDVKRLSEYHTERRKNPEEVPKEYEARLIDNEGNIRQVLVSVELIEGTDQTVAALMDLTYMYRLEDISKGLLESNHIGMLIVQNGVIREANPCAERMLGYPSNDLIGTDPLKFIPEEERETVHNIATEMLKGDRHQPYEHPFVDKDGDNGWVLEEISSLRYQGEDAALVVFIDKTLDKEISVALEYSEREYRAIVESAFAGICVADLDENLTFVNQTAAEMLGYTRDELMGMNVNDIFPPREFDKLKSITEKRREGISGIYESKMITKEDDVIDVLIHGTPLTDANGKVYATLGVISNITKSKKMQERENFLFSLLRHDIKNKVNVTRGYLELLEETQLTDKAYDLLDKAKRSVEDEIKLIEKVGMLGEIRKERMPRYQVSLAEVLNRSVEQAEDTASDKNITIRCLYDDIYVLGGALLEEMFFNLLNNAVEHSGCTTIKISAKKRDDTVVVVIEDDGKGLPEDIENKIFDSGVKDSSSKGMGIGLYIVKDITRAYGGEVTANVSELGGARFDIKLKKA